MPSHGRVVAEGPVAALRLAGVRRIRATLTGTAVEAVHPLLLAVPGLEEAPGYEGLVEAVKDSP